MNRKLKFGIEEEYFVTDPVTPTYAACLRRYSPIDGLAFATSNKPKAFSSVVPRLQTGSPA